MADHKPPPMQWDIPVLMHGRRRHLLVVVSDGDVAVLLAGVGCILPAESDKQLADAVREAREVAEGVADRRSREVEQEIVEEIRRLRGQSS